VVQAAIYYLKLNIFSYFLIPDYIFLDNNNFYKGYLIIVIMNKQEICYTTGVRARPQGESKSWSDATRLYGSLHERVEMYKVNRCEGCGESRLMDYVLPRTMENYNGAADDLLKTVEKLKATAPKAFLESLRDEIEDLEMSVRGLKIPVDRYQVVGNGILTQISSGGDDTVSIARANGAIFVVGAGMTNRKD
jgi:hypothetical protein